MISYSGIDELYGFNTLVLQLQKLETLAGRSFSNAQLMALLKYSNKNNRENWEAVKVLVQTLPADATADDIAEQLEDSLKLVDIAKEKEERRIWELK